MQTQSYVTYLPTFIHTYIYGSIRTSYLLVNILIKTTFYIIMIILGTYVVRYVEAAAFFYFSALFLNGHTFIIIYT